MGVANVLGFISTRSVELDCSEISYKVPGREKKVFFW